MSPLSTELRNRLANAIKAARRQGEEGATRALQGLAVDRHEPFGSMSQEERALRNRLRAHSRQLGDVRDRVRGGQEIGRLAHEVAYEHWHRMLFARFLAENHLLVEPDSGVAISMAECEDLAREQGDDPWALAGRFAQSMLPRIFRPDDPALAVTLAPETRQALERLLESLPVEVFTSDDALGWTYQFWQAERKDAVNASGVKIGADQLPAVTQLFTEHYMVLFLFHNTIGAWRAGKILAERPELAANAANEEELRQAVRLRAAGGYDFSYLRFVREPRDGDEDGAPTGPWRPAAGTFEGWPRAAAELRVLDPCCGSGHFLVEGFGLLVRLRMEEEGLSLEDAMRAVLAKNLFGLEIDPRCTQIAAFNLALAAWRLAGRPIELPQVNIACSGLAPNATKEQWLALAEQAAAAGGMPAERDRFETKDTLLSARVRGALSALYGLFEQAPELGSLIDPRALEANLFQSDFASVQPLLGAVLERERGDADAESAERAVAAQGMARAAELLAGDYTLVTTNVPYLGRRKQSSSLKDFADHNYGEAKADLATTFLARAWRWLGKDGTVAAVTLQNWLFLGTYAKLRERFLRHRTWNAVVRMGEHAFESNTAAGGPAVMLVLSAQQPNRNWAIAGVDVSAPRGQRPIYAREKATLLREGPGGGRVDQRRIGQVRLVPQAAQLDNPDMVLSLENEDHALPLLQEFAYCYQGAGLADIRQFRLNFWEIQQLRPSWELHQSSPSGSGPFTGMHFVVRWEQGQGELTQRSPMSGKGAWGKQAVAIAWLGTLPASLYLGCIYDNSAAVIVPKDGKHLLPIWCYCESSQFNRDVRKINQKPQVANATMVKVPFDLKHWQEVAAAKYPEGLPEPQTNDASQWLFHGHPAATDRRSVLQVAVARLLGYRWPAELDPDVRLADEARKLVEQCRDLHVFEARDGIACLSPARGEAGAADRVRRLLAAAFGHEWSAATERELLTLAASDGQPAVSLEEWLRDRFFEEHCKLFQQRPFVWHVWDGRKDGFHALVNYHRIAGPDGDGKRTLEALTYSYLGDWIQRQRADQRDGREGADGRLAAALNLQSQLERILAGEPPCDLFIRWKPLHDQPVGWEPDINDGVRPNIRPFLLAELREGGRRGAGILRWKPNLHWRKDPGQEPENLRPKDDFPWFWGCAGEGDLEQRTDFTGRAVFDGNRWNDLHYSTAAKRAARDRASR